MLGYIESKSDGDPRKDWRNLCGSILSGDRHFPFKYSDLRFDRFTLQLGLLVTFELGGSADAPTAVRVDKSPSEFGFLIDYDDRTRKGHFRCFTDPAVAFTGSSIRNEDEPLFGPLYVFDVIRYISDLAHTGTYPSPIPYVAGDLYVGARVSGTVKNVVEFGAFVTIGTRDALVYRDEVAWNMSDNWQSLVRPGMRVEMLITKIETVNLKERIGASIKALQPRTPQLGAKNIFRLEAMDKMKEVFLKELAARTDVLPEAKFAALRILRQDPALYRKHRESLIPDYFLECRKLLESGLDQGDFPFAYRLLQEYMLHDVSAVNYLDRFPVAFLLDIQSVYIANNVPLEEV